MNSPSTLPHFTLRTSDGKTAEMTGRKEFLEYHIGRKSVTGWENNQIFICEPEISRRQCRIFFDEIQQVWMAEDLKSANGTHLNGTPLTEPSPLSDGDKLQFGLVELRTLFIPDEGAPEGDAEARLAQAKWEGLEEEDQEPPTLLQPAIVDDSELDATDHRRLPAWASLNIFKSMSGEAILQLRDALHKSLYDEGEVIITQGDTGKDMFLLERGSIRIKVLDSDTEQISFERSLPAPAMFGEMSLLTHEPRTASVIADTRVICFRISKLAFDKLIDENPQIAVLLTKLVGERLLEADTIQMVGKYRVTGQIGAGAMATVFEGIHPNLQQPVALKMLSHSLAHNPKFIKMFNREARLVAGLRHENIVLVHDMEKAYGTRFIIMEKLNGTLLEDMIQEEVDLPWETIRKILIEIATALDYSHSQGLLHRDIKPSNIFITLNHQVKILDFGIAMGADEVISKESRPQGTPNYISPEQIKNSPLDGRTDLYALGILAFELINKDVPFHANSLEAMCKAHLEQPIPDITKLVPDVPTDLSYFILKATAKDPEDRFPSCAHAAAFLQEAAAQPGMDLISQLSVAIAYQPNRREEVHESLKKLQDSLGSLSGVSLVVGGDLQEEEEE